MKKVLWVGDGPDCGSGFGLASRKILESIDHRLGGEYDVTVLGINHRGDPGTVPYPVYAAAPGGDAMGVGRLVWMCDLVKPDVIVLQNDGWNIQSYVRQVRAKKPNGEFHFPEHASIPIVAIVAVDGKNFQGRWLDGVDHVVFWTQFALDEARAGGFKGSATVIPLGVDLDVYHPMDRYEARLRRGLPRELDEAFIVGNVNRNQPRKRWDLTIRYFAEWVRSRKIDDAYLYLHVAPTGDTGVTVHQLVKYYSVQYGIEYKTIIVEPATWYGLSDREMCDTYNCFDVAITTTQGEGFGLTALEAMACGVPVIAPDWSALGEWAKRGAWLVKCTSTAVGPPYVNVIGGVPDEKEFVMALHRLYVDKKAREQNATAALECAQQEQFRWSNVGKAFGQVLATVVGNVEDKKLIEYPAEVMA